MNTSHNKSLDRKIKRVLYGSAQTITAIFPPGLGRPAFDEVLAILNKPWIEQKYECTLTLLKNQIRIENIHLFTATELLMRSCCISDLRLIIYEGKAFGKSAFIKKCRDIAWEMFIDKSLPLKIKVNSIASRAFHEGGLKEILNSILSEHSIKIVSDSEAQESTVLYAELFKDRLTISISLAGLSLYKRGYRGVLSSSAPLREDAAACCIAEALKFAKHCNKNFMPQTLLVPFSGTGTFIFEFLIHHFNISPVLFKRDYALQKMPFFREENFYYLLKKAQEKCLLNTINAEKEDFNIKIIKTIYFNDKAAPARSSFYDNLSNFQKSLILNDFNLPDDLINNENNLALVFPEHDFFKMDVTKFLKQQAPIEGDLFLPLNPPYGIRLEKNVNTRNLYKNTAKKIKEIYSGLAEQQKNLAGCILCPNEENWGDFCKNIQGARLDTYHFTQGGLDIRVCQFYFESK